jgi:hypothetical protein
LRKLDFLPEFYKDKMLRRKIAGSFVILLILIAANILIQLTINNKENELYEYRKKFNDKKVLQAELLENIKYQPKDLDYYKDYKSIISYENDEISFLKIEITKDTITITGQFSSIDNIKQLIESLEDINGYKTINLIPIESSDREFTIILKK